MERPKKYFHPRPAEAGHPRQRGTSHLISPFGGGAGGGWKDQKNTSTPGLLKQATPASGGQAI